MQDQPQYRPGTAFVTDPEKGIAVPEEQYLAEQALKTEKTTAKKPSTDEVRNVSE